MKKRKLKPLSPEGIKTYPLRERPSKVQTNDLASAYTKRSSFTSFLKTLPKILAARDLKEIIEQILRAHQKGRPVITALGGHLIKVGLSPIIIDLIDRGVVTTLALSGAGIIHDFELAYGGATSEYVEESIKEGKFGMARETGELLNQAINQGVKEGLGLGKSIGKFLHSSNYPYLQYSIIASAYKNDVPATVHLAIGTDIINLHPSADGAALGEGTLRDFKLFASAVSQLEGGVYLNIGSAVMLPEVFIKALSLVRNLGHQVKKFTTVNIDFREQYRPLTNVVRRPTAGGGKGYNLIGHQEILLPLLAAGIIEGL